MTRKAPGYWLRTGEALCMIVTLTSLLPVRAARAGCASKNSFANFGAIESQTTEVTLPGTGYFNGPCAAQVTASGGGSGFVLSAPPANYAPSCLSSPMLDPGQECYFTVTFTPPVPGRDTATLTMTVKANGTTYYSYNTLYGAGFTLSPKDLSTCVNEGNGQCTGLGAPCSCCTGPGTGTCVDAFPLTFEPPPSSGYGYITFDPGDADIAWKGTLDYQTTGNLPTPPAVTHIKPFATEGAQQSISFGTAPSPDPAPSPKADTIAAIAGGQLQLDATYHVRNVGSHTNATTAYVTGIPASQSSPQGIPYATIYNQLKSLYGAVTIPKDSSFTPATLALMTQIAAVESGGFYEQQFFQPPNVSAKYPYSVTASWPLESEANGSKNGAHIGLMQVPVTQRAKLGKTTIGQANAWNWIQNATDGVECPPGTAKAGTCGEADSAGEDSFQEKLIMAYYNMQKMQGGLTPALGALSSCQLEEMALALYGPFAGGKNLDNQYYIPTCSGTAYNYKTGGTKTCSTSSWQWTVNTITTQTPYCGVCYVAEVRTTAFPNLGSTSSCGDTSGLPDPPTNLTNCGACPN